MMIRFNKFLNQKKLLLILSLSAIGITVAPNQANAFTLINRDNLTDTQFENLLLTGEYTETFVAEGRMGNNKSGGDRELGINNPILAVNGKLTNVTTSDEDHFTWKNGELVDFELKYDGKSVIYKVGGKELNSSKTFKGGAATDIFLRTFARNGIGGTSILKDLFLDGKAVGKDLISKATNGDDADYIQISGLTKPFTLTGKSSFGWTTPTAPTGSRLSYQIKVVSGSTQSVPEPGMIVGIFVAGAMGVANAKRKKQLLSH
jgi:hypothetical protein